MGTAPPVKRAVAQTEKVNMPPLLEPDKLRGDGPSLTSHKAQAQAQAHNAQAARIPAARITEPAVAGATLARGAKINRRR